jgi:hypothetical protein
MHAIQRFHMLWMAATMISQLIMGIIIAYMTPFLDKEPYHTSVLTRHAWVQELINGHPDQIKTELGMRKYIFHALLHELRTCRLRDSKYIKLDEQVAIFLYTCMTGLLSCHVAEHFQHSYFMNIHLYLRRGVCLQLELRVPQSCDLAHD